MLRFILLLFFSSNIYKLLWIFFRFSNKFIICDLLIVFNFFDNITTILFRIIFRLIFYIFFQIGFRLNFYIFIQIGFSFFYIILIFTFEFFPILLEICLQIFKITFNFSLNFLFKFPETFSNPSDFLKINLFSSTASPDL